jgi:hypothetical protein
VDQAQNTFFEGIDSQKETKVFLWNGFDPNLRSLGYLLFKFFEGINSTEGNEGNED